jgi:hypothetical protein
MLKETTRTEIAGYGAVAMLLGMLLYGGTTDRLFQGWLPLSGICLAVVGVAAYVYGMRMNKEKARRRDETDTTETKP